VEAEFRDLTGQQRETQHKLAQATITKTHLLVQSLAGKRNFRALDQLENRLPNSPLNATTTHSPAKEQAHTCREAQTVADDETTEAA
jgi:hypothetical protein